MSVDEKTAPFEVHEFTSRDAAIAVLRTMESCFRTVCLTLLACTWLFILASIVLRSTGLSTAGVIFGALNIGCLIAARRVSREVARLTGEDR